MNTIDDISSARILIVDDQDTNLRLLEDLLEREGFSNIISTSDPERALELYRAIDPDLAAEMYEWLSETLEINGYIQYEISNWAKPKHECRHNLQYWRGLPYLAFGAGAHGHAGLSGHDAAHDGAPAPTADDRPSAEEALERVQLRDRMLQNHGCFVRNCGNKLGSSEQYFRIAARPAEDVNYLVEAFKIELAAIIHSNNHSHLEAKLI